MMAVRSPLSILSYQDTSSPYAGSDHMSLEGSPFPSTRNSNYSTSASDPLGATEAQTYPNKQDAETVDTSAVSVRPTAVSQSGLTIQTEYMQQVEITHRSDEDEPPQSVIHAPPGFGDFTDMQADESCQKGPGRYFQPPTHQTWSMKGVGTKPVDVAKVGNSPISPPPLSTNVTPAKDWSERATPRAQTRHDFEDSERRTFGHKAIEINALRAALTECWTLCNTLASLSYINRERVFRSHEDDVQEDAWRSCWRLCQKLYDTRDDDYTPQVNPTLDLCRDFCQALFEVRVCDNDLADSVLRVSFELNNHLFNTHDRNLPDAFRERTLDFYITLCHRLMKQRMRLTETDSLLSACWTLAEMLFSMRQSKREGKVLDEEILGSAVQACWELCDIFREGWTLHNMRNSDRGTPRPSQTTFAQAFQQATQQAELEFADDALGQVGNPETPTTIFEDTATVSPDEAPVPNILVLGHGNGHASHSSHSKWPSNASSISEKSRSSGQTASSANTVTTISEDPNFTRLKVLITKAAIDSGYQRGGPQNLSSFVKSLPSDAFGLIPWQTSLLKNYRKLVSFDPAFRNAGYQARVSAIEVAHACQAMVQSGQYSWLRDLYRLVFGFHMEEAMGRKSVIIQT
ncbi:hypothetical protein N7523_010515 [Penicillium sp. IBT 18751x]|nr:hypothetical protein N7523_010515 [Penicillium sp. IBT 18751x]